MITNNSKILPETDSASQHSVEIFDKVNYFLMFKDSKKFQAFQKHQKKETNFTIVTLIHILISAYFIISRVGYVQSHYSAYSVIALVVSLVTSVFGGLYIACAFSSSCDISCRFKKWWIQTTNLSFCLGMIYMTIHSGSDCISKDFVKSFECGFGPDQSPDSYIIGLLALPIVLSLIVRGICWKTQLITWVMNNAVLIGCISYAKMTDSVVLFVILSPMSFAVLYSCQLQELRLFFASEHQIAVVQEKERAAEVEHVAEMRSLIGNMAHDLKTPLAGFLHGIDIVTSLLQELQTDLEGLDGVTAKKHQPVLDTLEVVLSTLNNITHTNSFMLMTINRCIDFTKANKGVKLEPRFETVSLNEVLSLPLGCMRDMQSRIQITCDPLNAEICSYIITDKQWLQENILCLLSNAVKYSSRGEVKVSVTLFEQDSCAIFPAVACTSSEQQQDEWLCFEIEDSGVGLDEEVMQNLFTPFKQAQRFAGGTGLGLYSLAKRIEALKGTYGVRHRRDGKQGSLFWFTIPYRPDLSVSCKVTRSASSDKHLSNQSTGGDTIPNTPHTPVPHPPGVQAHNNRNNNRNSNSGDDFNRNNKTRRVSVNGLSPAHSSALIIQTKMSTETEHQGNSFSESERTVLSTKLHRALTSATQATQYSELTNAPLSLSTPTQSNSTESMLPQKPKDPSSGLSILLVDDALSILKMTSMLLKRKGHVVDTAENGAEALIKLAEANDGVSSSNGSGLYYDVVLMDVQMPVMDGLEATRRWRKTENNGQKPAPTSPHSPKGSRMSYRSVGSSDQGSVQSRSPAKNGYIRTGGASPGGRARAGSGSSKFHMFGGGSSSQHSNKYEEVRRHQLIIGVSANSDHDTMLAAFECGIDAFIPKPFDIACFHDTYSALLAAINSAEEQE